MRGAGAVSQNKLIHYTIDYHCFNTKKTNTKQTNKQKNAYNDMPCIGCGQLIGRSEQQ